MARTTESRFFRYELRTTEINGARTFYEDVLGSRLWGLDICVSALPERAATQGAPAHWLGHISVNDVEDVTERMVAAGGQQLEPTQEGTGGSLLAVVRDPFGAVMALSSATAPPAPRQPAVVWHIHHGQDHLRSFAWYAALFGWTATELVDLGPHTGRYQMFAWDESGQTAGAMSNIARLPNIHPQWLFFFRVHDLESSLAKVRASGGKVVGSMSTSSGDIVAPCDDPQGGAFALYQFTREFARR